MCIFVPFQRSFKDCLGYRANHFHFLIVPAFWGIHFVAWLVNPVQKIDLCFPQKGLYKPSPIFRHSWKKEVEINLQNKGRRIIHMHLFVFAFVCLVFICICEQKDWRAIAMLLSRKRCPRVVAAVAQTCSQMTNWCKNFCVGATLVTTCDTFTQIWNPTRGTEIPSAECNRHNI